MSGGWRRLTDEEWIGRLMADGWTDDEIVDDWASRRTRVTLHKRNRFRDLVASVRAGHPLTAANGMTPLARDIISKIPAEAARLRRTGGITLSALATKFEVDRGTLHDWIERGWMADPREPKPRK